MKKIEQAILSFNEEFIDDERFLLEQSNPGTKEELNKIQVLTNTVFPLSLQEFYQNIGGLSFNEIYEDDREGVRLNLYSISNYLHFLNATANWEKLYSFGLIDYLKFNWDNDRPEFEDIEPEKIAYLNENYKCFGVFSFNFNEHHSLYFDKDGNFGKISYNQNNFYGLWNEHLNGMLIKSPAKETFENLISSALEEIKQVIIRW